MKYFLLCISALLCYAHSNSQHIIIKKNGDEIKAKVIEIVGTTIKYKKEENLDGPLYNIDQVEVFKIMYGNGQSDFFGNVTETKTTPAPAPILTPPVTTQKKKQATSAVVIADLPKKYPQPPATNIPYWYDEGRNILVELEKVTYKTEIVRSGLWGKHNLMILPGPFSNVQITKKQEPQFIIQLDKDTEPYTSCVLNTSEVNDAIKRREWVMSTKGMHSEKQHDDVQIEFEKIGSELYLVTLNKKLKPGELFFWVSEASQVYAFGYSK